jgi:cytochrome b561
MSDSSTVVTAPLPDSLPATIYQRQWQRSTRWLHALIALGIGGQLLLSLLMAHPDHLQHADALGRLTLKAHEYLGLATFAIVLAHWVWLVLPRSDVSYGHLFPWSGVALRLVKNDAVHLWRERKLPPVNEAGGLSGLIHGLGLLNATAMVVSGLGLYLLASFGGGVKSTAFHTLGDMHSAIGNLMWTYLIGHVLAAIWHQHHGERIISTMFRF